MILAGDIGGTKTNLALYEYVDGVLIARVEHQFSSQKYSTFFDVIEEFLKLFDSSNLDALCLGVAGPVINGTCKTTNLPWLIDSKELKKELSINTVYLLNDLEATAYGMLYLKEEEFVNLNPDAKELDANRAVIAVGTGLGEAMLYYDGENYHPIASEGGHCDFAPLNALQDDLLLWMRRDYPQHVSVERLVSGVGIYTIYQFLKERGFAPECERMNSLEDGEDKNAMVTECALEEGDPLCLETMRLFVEIYAAEAGNLALKSLSLGGVYIGGGIAPKILPFLTNGDFLSTFVRKGRFEKMLQNIELKIALNPKTALLGAAYFGLDKTLEKQSS